MAVQTSNIKFSIKEKALLVTTSGMFILLFMILCFYNRFSADDYYSIAILRTHNIFQYAEMIYREWNIRLLPQLFASVIIKFSTIPHLLFAYGLVSLSFLVFSIRLFLKNLFATYFNIQQENIILFSYAVFISIFFFFITFRIDETWFWLSSSVTYLWGNSMLIAGSALIIGNSANFKSFLCLIFCFLYTGSSSEPLAVATISVLILLIIFFLLKLKFIEQIRINKSVYYKISCALFACLAGFLFNYLSPGRSLRAALFQQPDLINGIWITLKTIAKIVLDFFPYKILYALLLSFPFIYLGFSSRLNNENKTAKGTIANSILVSLLVLFSISFISLFPMAYIMQDVALNRTLTHVSFIILIFFIYWFFRIGYEMKLNTKLFRKLFSLSLDLIIILLIVIVFHQYKTVSAYADEVDKRINYLDELKIKGQTQCAEVTPLPSSGFLHSAEISGDSVFEQNQHFRNGLSLDFLIKVKK